MPSRSPLAARLATVRFSPGIPDISWYGRAAPHAVATPYAGKSHEARSFTVAATGDVLLHGPLIAQARRDGHGKGLDFYPLLKGVRDVIGAADLAICHLETPLAPPGGPFHGYPVFSVPPQVVRAIKRVGYDTCSTASNHTIDQGAAGVRRTLRALEAAGLRHAGSARSAAEAARVTLLEVRGVRVAHLSYTYGTNGMMEPRNKPWLVNDGLDPRVIIKAARRARAEGAEVVIVSLHWGTEYQHAPDARQRRVAGRLLASPAIDLIVGHHAHVVQPWDRIHGKWVVYGLGNQVANPSAGPEGTHQGVIAWFRFRRTREGWSVRPALLPTRIGAGPPIRLGKASGLHDVIRIVRALGERVPVLR
ncbi:CapA family protein [Nonomuraea sediminis]|uniref:CapA family protein n=1 Tax=Nonomuraea sediminis TaxID=2835864 RepID=UPI001BDCF0E5|nr:CapA family protein [Nonomuraea sediminis]